MNAFVDYLVDTVIIPSSLRIGMLAGGLAPPDATQTNINVTGLAAGSPQLAEC